MLSYKGFIFVLAFLALAFFAFNMEVKGKIRKNVFVYLNTVLAILVALLFIFGILS